MGRTLYWKVITIVLVLVSFGVLLIKRQVPLGLDLKGGVQLVVKVDTDYAVRLESQRRTLSPADAASVREDTVARTMETLERRIDELGVSEPSIARQGTAGDEILIQLPGMTEVDRAKAIILAGGTLELRLVELGPSASPEALGVSLRKGDAELLSNRATSGGDPAGRLYYIVNRQAAITGRDLRS